MSGGEETSEAELVVFSLGDQRYALDLRRVERVVRMVALAPLPRAPEIVSGLFDLHGELLPAIDMRKRFRLPPRPAQLEDHLVVARTSRRRLALHVDRVESVVRIPREELTAPAEIVPGLEFVRGIAQLPREGIVFIHDLDTLLSLDEETGVTAALAGLGR